MPYLVGVGAEEVQDGAETTSPAELSAKMDRLLKAQERSNQLRKVSIALTAGGLVIGLVRLGDVLRQLRRDRRARQAAR